LIYDILAAKQKRSGGHSWGEPDRVHKSSISLLSSGEQYS